MTDAEDREILRRIDRRLERGDELMELCRAAFERNTQAFERNREALERFATANDDLRGFIREMTVRIERGTQTQVRALSDMSDQIRANTQAVLRVLDRLDGGAAAAAT